MPSRGIVLTSAIAVAFCPLAGAADAVSKPLLHRAHCEAKPPPWWKLRGGAGACPPPDVSAFSLARLRQLHPVLLAFLGTSFGWFMTALGYRSAS